MASDTTSRPRYLIDPISSLEQTAGREVLKQLQHLPGEVHRLALKQETIFQLLTKLEKQLFGNGQPGVIQNMQDRLHTSESAITLHSQKYEDCPAREYTSSANKALRFQFIVSLIMCLIAVGSLWFSFQRVELGRQQLRKELLDAVHMSQSNERSEDVRKAGPRG